MIKNLDELWSKMQIEFEKINQQFKDNLQTNRNLSKSM